MGTDELRAALAETAEVLRTMGATVKLATCDAKVQGLTEVRTIDEVQLHGGGGTDMRPAFVALEAERERPEIVVCITDGQVGDGIPKYEPDWCRTVFILVGVNRKRPCTWGEQIEIDETGAREVAAA
jgi:predicted metal-dependent peptidase